LVGKKSLKNRGKTEKKKERAKKNGSMRLPKDSWRRGNAAPKKRY